MVSLMSTKKWFLCRLLVVYLLKVQFSGSDAKIVQPVNTGPRIVNGDQASVGQFPWQVAIYFTSGVPRPSTWFCSGTLISEEWILTAAHCIGDAFIGMVNAGTVDFVNNLGAQILAINFTVHENFDIYTLRDDIALVKTDIPIPFNDNITAINLTDDPLDAGVEIVVSGWGEQATNSTGANVLYYTRLTTIDNSECDAIYGQGTISDEMFCALSSSGEVTSTCFGDSGGPAVLYDGNNDVLVGIITFISNKGCEYGDPSGFARVAYYRDWIREKSGI